MGVGPEPSTGRLFDRIASEIAAAADPPGMPSDEHDAEHGDDTAELRRADGSPSGGIVIDRSGAWPAPDVSTQMERPIIAERQCSRTGCADAAAVTLSYHYGTSQVWIDRLWPEREPHMYDMCERHAARLSVPRGWHLDDRRRLPATALLAV